MSALGHYLEEEGLPTVSISLIREHTEIMRPPRALWVPFELGRPLGAPNEPEFQKRVLRATLGLLECAEGPVLEDFEEDAPGALLDRENEGWACPVSFPKPEDGRELTRGERVIAEIEGLRPWHDLFRERFGRSTVGVGGRPLEEGVRLLERFVEDPDTALAAVPDEPPDQAFKLPVDDLMAFYQEAANAQPGGGGTSQQVMHWFWTQTELGALLMEVREAAPRCSDERVRFAAERLLLPRMQQARLSTAGEGH